MKEFQQKRKIRRFLYSRIAILTLFILVALVGKAVYSVYYKERESRRNLERTREELASLQARQNSLKNVVSRLQTPEGREAEIRGQFQVAKPGERMVVIVESEKDQPELRAEKTTIIARFFGLFRQ